MSAKVDEEIIARAAEVIHGYCQSRDRQPFSPLKDAPENVRLARMSDAEGAILSFLRSMAEKGERMMPRTPSEAMHRTGMDERRMQDDLNKAHHVIIDTSDIWTAMFDAHAGSHP